MNKVKLLAVVGTIAVGSALFASGVFAQAPGDKRIHGANHNANTARQEQRLHNGEHEGLSDEQIQNYIRMKEEEDMQMLSMIDESIKASMEALGDELKQYLKEAGESFPEDEEHKPAAKKPSNNPLEPFIGIFGGVKEIFTSFGGIKPAGSETQSTKRKLTGGKNDIQLDQQIKTAKEDLKRTIYQTYKNYKKMHNMVQW